MAKKYHIQASGADRGALVLCKAEVSCRLGSESEHLYFSSPAQAREFSELLEAKSNGGLFGEGLSERESQRMSELRAISELNRVKERPTSTSDLYLAPSTTVERRSESERRVGSNFESRGSSPSTISKRVSGELETAKIAGFLRGATGVGAAVKNQKLGKEIRVELTVDPTVEGYNERELMSRAARIAESFGSSSYLLTDDQGTTKRQFLTGDRISIEIVDKLS